MDKPHPQISAGSATAAVTQLRRSLPLTRQCADRAAWRRPPAEHDHQRAAGGPSRAEPSRARCHTGRVIAKRRCLNTTPAAAAAAAGSVAVAATVAAGARRN